MMVVVLGWEKRVMRDLRPRLLNAWKEYLLRGRPLNSAKFYEIIS
jgi:hypothetical protein